MFDVPLAVVYNLRQLLHGQEINNSWEIYRRYIAAGTVDLAAAAVNGSQIRPGYSTTPALYFTGNTVLELIGSELQPINVGKPWQHIIFNLLARHLWFSTTN